MSAAGKASINAVMGSTQTGKSQGVKQRLRAPWPGLTLIWSYLEPTDNYAAWTRGTLVNGSVAALVRAVKAGRRTVIYYPSKVKQQQQFALFCRIAWECEGARVLAEELSNVTTAQRAPPEWRLLSTAGRHRGLELIGTSQRPAHIDKDFLGGCTTVRCYRLNHAADAKAVAEVMRVPWVDLMDLPDLHYLERDMAARSNTAGIQAIVAAGKKKPA